jgi:predicted nuclease of predicted toxin-antitoxin system
MLAETNAVRPSVVQLRAGNLRPEVIGLRVVEAMRELREALAAGALVTIDLKKTRMRVLPMKPTEDF